jgi:hypothetical protein
MAVICNCLAFCPSHRVSSIPDLRARGLSTEMNSQNKILVFQSAHAVHEIPLHSLKSLCSGYAKILGPSFFKEISFVILHKF